MHRRTVIHPPGRQQADAVWGLQHLRQDADTAKAGSAWALLSHGAGRLPALSRLPDSEVPCRAFGCPASIRDEQVNPFTFPII